MVILSKVFNVLWLLSILLLCFLVIYDAIEGEKGERTVLSGDEWECSDTKRSNKFAMVGGVMVPFYVDECVRYEKK